MSSFIIFLVLLITFPLITAISDCEKWMSIGELKSQAQPGDKIVIRRSYKETTPSAVQSWRLVALLLITGKLPNASQSLPRVVLYVGNGQIVYGVAGSNGKEMMRLGNMNELVGANGTGCIRYSLGANITLSADPDTSAILKRGLTQLGKPIEVATNSNTPEENLANYARYGHHNRSWIEAALNQSSLVLTDQIKGISYQLNEEINKSFGAFTKMLAEKTMDALHWSSMAAANSSSSALDKVGELAKKASASSAGNSIDLGTSFQIGKN